MHERVSLARTDAAGDRPRSTRVISAARGVRVPRPDATHGVRVPRPDASRHVVIAVDAAPGIVDALSGALLGSTVVAVDLAQPVGDVLAGLAVLEPDGIRPASVVLLHDSRRPHTLAAARARALAPSGVVLPVGVNLPPVGRVCAAFLLADLAGRTIPGSLLACIAPDVAREVRVYARVSSVAKLRRPSPSMAQHISSYLPNSSFLISFQPEPSVTSFTREAVLRTLPLPPPGSLVVTSSSGDERGLDLFSARLAADTVSVSPEPSSSQWYGASVLTEVMTIHAVRSTLDRLADNAVAGVYPCRWCRQAVRGSSCVACGMSREEDPPRPV